jgi:hypothetical protein
MQDDSIDSPDALLLKIQGKNAIYHERVTLLIEILGVSERNGFFRFEANPAFRSSSLVDLRFL